MKKMLILAITMATFAFIVPTGPLTDKERKDAIDLLHSTQKELMDELKGLSPAQLAYKPSADRWSVEECVKHIVVTEGMLWQMNEAAIKQPANPEKRSEIKITDEQAVKMVEDRSEKRKTSDNLKPENTKFATLADALDAFRANRTKLEDYIKTTNDDLRGHVIPMPFGSVDSYQMILFQAAHTNRHTQQLREVKADAGFPKN